MGPKPIDPLDELQELRLDHERLITDYYTLEANYKHSNEIIELQRIKIKVLEEKLRNKWNNIEIIRKISYNINRS